MKRLIAILSVVALLFSGLAFGQNTYGTPGRYGLQPWAINNQRVASQYNYDFDSLQAMTGGAASFTFPQFACYLNFGGNKVATGPSASDTIKIIDAVSSNTETLAQTAPSVTNGQCVLAPTSAAHSHYSYHARSGTCGLVPALVDLNGQGGEVIVDQKFYDDGCTVATITGTVVAAAAQSNQFVHDVSNGKDEYYSIQPTTLSALATPATRSATAGATQVISGTATGTWTAAATYVCVTYVDALGGESPCSATYNLTATASVALNFASPAASTGAVGWRAYAGASYAAAYLLPVSASTCTLTTGEVVFPACAIGSAGVFPDPVTTSSLHPGYVVNTYNPNTQSHTTFGYQLTAPGVLNGFQRNYGPFVASSGGTTGQIEVLGTVPLPSGFLNNIGRSIRVSGHITMTAGTSETPVVKLLLGPTFTTGTPTAICQFANTTALSAAVYSLDFTCRMTTNATGSSGTVMPGGVANVALGAGTTAGTGMPELGTAAITDKLDSGHLLYVVYVPTSGTNTAAQLLDLHLESLN